MAIAAGPLADSASLSHLTDQDVVDRLAPITHHPGTVPSVFTNWATTFRSQTKATFTPTSIDQVRLVVELATRTKTELRAAGAGHSPSDIVCTSGFVVDLKGVNKLITVDTETKTFHAEGGILLRNLHPLLSRHGLALSSLGSISDQTLAGAISTSTHGSGVTFGTLSTYVTFLDVVLPLAGAPVVRVSQDDDPDLFKSALCGLGVVGVIVAVGMRAEPLFNLEEELFSVSFDTFERNWREIAESAEHVRCWWFPQIGRVKVSRLNRTTKPITARPNRFKTWLVERLLATHVHAAALFVSRTFPSILPYHAHVMWNLVHQPGPLRWTELFGRIQWPRPRSTAAAALSRREEDTTTELLTVPSVDTKRKVLANPPSDVITPPPTPPTPASPPTTTTTTTPRIRERSPSPLSSSSSVSDLELPTVVSSRVDQERVPSVPWPILESEPTYRVDSSVGIFNYDCGFPQYTYESSVPYDSTGDALRSLAAWHVSELHHPDGYRLGAHFPIEVRWTEQDDVWLSPCYQRRGTFLGAIQYRPYNLPVAYRSTFDTFASLITLHGGRPHWAKTHTLTPSVLSELYPKFKDFLAVRARVDPDQVLVNGYARRHLLGQDEEGRTLIDGSERERWHERSREWKVRKLAPPPRTSAGVEQVVEVPKVSVTQATTTTVVAA